MKNPIKIVVIIAIVAGIGFGAYAFSQNSSNSDSMMEKDETVIQKDTQDKMQNTEDTTLIGDRYVEYSKAALEKAVSNRRVLFFFASWCPTCRPADANFKENISKIPEDVTLVRVNYNDPETDQEEKDLAKKYSVTYQHTFVQIDSNGREVTKWNGGQLNELLSNSK